MKNSDLYHLCLTQSPLITLVFKAAMKQLGMPDEKVRSISRRSVRPAGTGICLDELSDELEDAFKSCNRSAYQRLRADLFSRVSELTEGQLFHAYIPHTQRLMFQEVISHPACAGYLFIEEGFTSMAWSTHQGRRTTLTRDLQNRLRAFWTGSNYRSGRDMFDISSLRFRGAFSISRHAFHGMAGVRNVSGLIATYESHGGPPRMYVVLDTSYLHRGIRWKDYEDALVEAIAGESGSVAETIVKFHFADEKAAEHFESLRARAAAAGCGPMKLEGRDFSVEDELTAGDCLLFAVSSMGYYVASFGGRVRCFAPGVKGLDLDHWIQRHLLPEDFREIVGLV